MAMAKSKMDHVVVDAVAFFRNVQLQDIAENVYSLEAVVSEIRDKSTRQRLAVLPYELKLREPSAESIRFVSDFARKTGDYQSLSAVDIRVLALAYQLTKEHVGIDHLKTEPEKKATFSTKKNLEGMKDIAGFYYPAKKSDEQTKHEKAGDVMLKLSELEVYLPKETEGTEEDGGDRDRIALEEGEKEQGELRTSKSRDGEDVINKDGQLDSKDDLRMQEGSRESEEEEEENRNEGEETGEREKEDNRTGKDEEMEGINPGTGDDSKNTCSIEENNGEMEQNVQVIEEEDEVEDEDDDDIGWITPQNISQVKQHMGGGDEASLEGVRVGCMTTDFAMQNVLIQMGIPVISVNGMQIKRAKSFAFRCHDCFKVTHDMNKVFCPKCGNKSLDKVTVSVDEDGTQRYHLSRRRGVNTRGLRYALPKPQGGKHASNPILSADQHGPQNRLSRKAQMRTDVFNPDYEAMNSPFATHDLTSRSAQLGVRRMGGQGSGSRRNPNENRRGNKKGKRR